MKKCIECNVDMKENYGIRPGRHATGHTDRFLYIVGNDNDHFGIKISHDWIKCRICPKCGKIELYLDPTLLHEKS